MNQDDMVCPRVSGTHDFFLFDKRFRWRVYLLIHTEDEGSNVCMRKRGR